MKATSVVCALLLVVVAAPFVAAAAGPGPDAGFRGFKWGDPPTGLVDLRGAFPCSSTSTIKMDRYLSPADFGRDATRSVGGRDASDISYCFYKKRLCRVDVEWEMASAADFDQIGTALSLAWGKPDIALPDHRQLWNSKKDVVAILLPPQDGGAGATLQIADPACARVIARDAAGL